MTNKKVVIAGALGFVGRHLIEHFYQNTTYEIYALTRNSINKEGQPSKLDKRLKFVQCDLFSLLDLERALEGMDYAIYLVHSMLPTSKLVQANFEDIDLILSDNFARAAKKSKIKQIIYLGGIIPNNIKLSAHLSSRLETEETLKSYGTPLTSLRAAIIIGKGGSSYNIILKLVKRLPIMICPSWCKTRSNPIWIGDVIKSIDYVLGNDLCMNKYYDISGSTCLTYLEMLSLTANYFDHKRYFLNFPFFTIGLSKLWVCLITQTPKNLVYPLLNSLRYEMTPDKTNRLTIENHINKSFIETLDATENEKKFSFIMSDFNGGKKFKQQKIKTNSVRSIQRLHCPNGKSATWVTEQYMKWLPNFFKFIKFIEVNIEGSKCIFTLSKFKSPILILERSIERSSSDRELLYVKGGLLAHKNQGRGRLEFRKTTCGRYFLVALHDFIPALPWFIYKYTQAPFHLYVMKNFQKYMATIK